MAATAAAVSIAGTAAASPDLRDDFTPAAGAPAACATTSAPSASPLSFAVLGDTVFFSANDGTRGRELWKSDGTEAGTTLVKNIRPDTSDRPGSTPRNLTVVGDALYFSADDGTRGRELWRTDGTRTSTVLVKDIHPSRSGSPGNLAARGRTLFFSANDGTHGVELWKSDGTAAGTALVKNIAPQGAYYPGSFPDELTAMGGRVYFAADDGTHGTELWRSNGSKAGTVLVKDIDPVDDVPHYPGSNPSSLTRVGERLYFAASDGTTGTELWRSDGSRLGTARVKDIDPGGRYSDSYPDGLTGMGDRLFFSADDGSRGEELWRSDGTAAGTVLVKNIDPETDPDYPGSYPSSLTPADGQLFFAASAGTGTGLWKSDGSRVGTVLVSDTEPSDYYSPSAMTAMAGEVFFAAEDATHGQELWGSDGTTPGTAMVANINPCDESAYYGNSRPRHLIAQGGQLFFAADDGTHGDELWTSDGTADGTTLVKDIRP